MEKEFKTLKKINKKEIKELSQEEADKIVDNMDEEMDILFNEKEGMNVKLPYNESYNKHWANKIKGQLLFFYELGVENEKRI